VQACRSGHDGPPDLAVEVRSPGSWHLDIGPKRDVYEASGTEELWPLLPEFALPIDELFA